ncbi:hypothetical protein CIK62_17645 [Brevibacterium aurantiacum]|uniref:Uncharacterized protein n=1 Tax=Brevibacterium aurantiacum TaxID=273384 RepID=A0A2A3ZBB2_BREAU|nr:hypothetical protein [Brevibacterium aurantiacum]PCC48635.1 hypothetical protein CIK62_17645 [Brevibacterium aurantiacum]
MFVAANAEMLSAKNLKELDDASLRFTVVSRQTKASHDLATHFRWNGEYTADGQIIDMITPKGVKRLDPDRVKKRREPVWSAEEHPDAWRVVWQYRRKRAMSDEQTLNLQRNRALAIESATIWSGSVLTVELLLTKWSRPICVSSCR